MSARRRQVSSVCRFCPASGPFPRCACPGPLSHGGRCQAETRCAVLRPWASTWRSIHRLRERQRRGRSTAHPAMALDHRTLEPTGLLGLGTITRPRGSRVGRGSSRQHRLHRRTCPSEPIRDDVGARRGSMSRVGLVRLSKHNCDFCWQGSCALLRGMVAAFKLESLARIVGIRERAGPSQHSNIMLSSQWINRCQHLTE